MRIAPAADEFARRYDAGAAQVVWTRLVADLETPVSATLKLTAGRTHCFLLESVEDGAVRGRYSMIGVDPDLVFRARGAKAEVNRRAGTNPDSFEPMTEPTLAALRTTVASLPAVTIVPWEGAGHLLHEERPDAAVRVVTEALMASDPRPVK